VRPTLEAVDSGHARQCGSQAFYGGGVSSRTN
jgi:hypothetical protein